MVQGILDTSVVIDIYRGFEPAVEWLNSNRDVAVGIASIVWLEAVEGAQNKRNQNKIVSLLKKFEIVYLNQDDQIWAMRQLSIYQLSHQVGFDDYLIAAPCHRLGLTLYTRNLKHFIPLSGDQVKEPYTLET
jgi:predicted nucleic acid-binding protein